MSDKEIFYHSRLAYMRYKERLNALEAGDRERFEQLKTEHAGIQTWDKQIERKCEAEVMALNKKIDLTDKVDRIVEKANSGNSGAKKYSFGACDGNTEEVSIPMNNVVFENNKICLEADASECDAKDTWLSQADYVKKLYPSYQVNKISYKSSVAVKDGKTVSKKELIACVIGG